MNNNVKNVSKPGVNYTPMMTRNIGISKQHVRQSIVSETDYNTAVINPMNRKSDISCTSARRGLLMKHPEIWTGGANNKLSII